jgi:ABC-type Mn2+/Zn2+ transport system ATPase subunit
MSRLSTVRIRRFKRIEDATIPLAHVTTLIGANNSGKSSVLQAIHFAVSIAQTAKLIGEGVSWQRDAYALSFNPSQLLYSPVSDVLSLGTGGRLGEPKESQIEIELTAEGGEVTTVGLRRGRNRNIAVTISGRAIGEQLMALDAPFTVYAPGLAGIPKEERYLSAGVVRRIVARGDANLTLRNVLRMLKDNPKAWSEFHGSMRAMFPHISIDLDFDAATDEHVNVFFQMEDKRFPIDAAGTSVLQASQLLAYISLFSPKILILDEPDSHLHPDNQRLLCNMVADLAHERGFQVLISTHSRHVLDTLSSRGQLVWMSKGKVVDQPDKTTTAVLLDIGALDSVDYFADGARRCVVATEDTILEPLKLILLSNGFVESEFEIRTYAGCSKIDSAAVLGQFLSEKAPHVKFVVHRDRDYMSGDRATQFEEQLRKSGSFPFLTEGNDIESYFLSAEHLHALNPAISVERMREIIEQATIETKEKSLEAIINMRMDEAFATRRAGGVTPNYGKIAVQASADYDSDPIAYRRGKIVMARLKALLQLELKVNPRIFFQSEFLRVAELSTLSGAIWTKHEAMSGGSDEVDAVLN